MQDDPVAEALSACLAVIDAKKGEEIVVLDTRLHTLVDYIVVATAASGRQMKAIAEEMARVLKRDGFPVRGVEGTPKSGWILMDAGDLIVHLFLPEARRYYDLEMMWGDVPRLNKVQ